MKELVKVKVLEAEFSTSKVSGLPTVSLRFEPLEDITRPDGVTVHVLYGQLINDNIPMREQRSRFLAQLRHALGLEIMKDPLRIYREPIVAKISEDELATLIGKHLIVEVDLEEFMGMERFRVTNYFRTREDI